MESMVKVSLHVLGLMLLFEPVKPAIGGHCSESSCLSGRYLFQAFNNFSCT